MSDIPLLQINNLVAQFQTRDGIVRAIANANLEIYEGEIVGLVGESGSGKSTLGLSIVQLLPAPEGEIVSGEILYKGKDLLDFSPQEIRVTRGCEISMTFQDPMTYLNPVMRVGDQITEAILRHQEVNSNTAVRIAIQLIEKVRIPDPERIFEAFPHQLSGGMRQRILIAIALSCNPNLIIADEPTTALDVTIQQGIIELLKSIREDLRTAILLITHDLGVVSEMCERVYVMYAGQILEHGSVEEIIDDPKNPYTRALLLSAKSIDEFHETLYAIGGTTPSLINPISGCRFRDRCQYAFDQCVDEPPIVHTTASSWSKCWLHQVEDIREC
jgi:oligopeptide/dipeptide ABC transporter ATP-binding protein